MRSGSANSTLPAAGGVARPIWVAIQTRAAGEQAATSGMAIRVAMSPPRRRRRGGAGGAGGGGEGQGGSHASSLASGAGMRHPTPTRIGRGAIPRPGRLADRAGASAARRAASPRPSSRAARLSVAVSGIALRTARGRRRAPGSMRAARGRTAVRRGGEGGRGIHALLRLPRLAAVAGAEDRRRDRRPRIERRDRRVRAEEQVRAGSRRATRSG